MSHNLVSIRELTGWGFDGYDYRPDTLELAKGLRASNIIAQRSPFEQSNIVQVSKTEQLSEMFVPFAERLDLLAEMSGLSWSLGVVDLRPLIAFQRRLAFTARMAQPAIPVANDWLALLKLSFGSPKRLEYEAIHDRSTETFILRSDNPNLHLRITNDPAHPLSVHGGGPFFEVARFRNRWFLRDGYHRAYALLQAQVFEVPAVIVEAATIEDLGANQPWFFPEEVLFSNTPPRVVDFLDEALILEYDRPPLIKTLRIKMDETLKPATLTGEQQ
jgi:hypothetical protein